MPIRGSEHAQTVCTRPSLSVQYGPGNEAKLEHNRNGIYLVFNTNGEFS